MIERGAYLGVQLEPPIRREHHDRRRAKRVLCRQQDTEVVESAFELRPRRTAQSAVPFLRPHEVRVGRDTHTAIGLSTHKDVILHDMCARVSRDVYVAIR